MFCQNLFSTLSAAKIHSCVLWLWHFLKSVIPHWRFVADTDSSRAPGITSDFYGSKNVYRGTGTVTKQKVQHTLTVRKTCVKRTLSIWIEHHTFNVCFIYRMLCMRFEKHALNAWYEKCAFYHQLKSFMLTYYNPCIKLVFLETHV